MADLERLSSWRRFASDATQPVPVSRVTDRVAAHHREQLRRSRILELENLQAHDQFCKAIEAYVLAGASERSEEHQQRVTDYAGYILRLHENTSARALERALFNVLQDLPHEVEVIRVVREAPPSQLPPQSRLRRFLIG
jgi:hypothetical protein